jgi:hypothetical protein
MKAIMYIHVFGCTMLPVFCPVVGQTQGIHLTSGIQWVTQGTPSIVLNNASLINNGNFIADSSSVIFTGDMATTGAFIGGANPVSFYNLRIGNSAKDLQLNNNAFVTGRITLDSGNLQLNSYTLDLGNTGSIEGERDEARITDSQGGTIRITAQLNRPRAVNPGNIGVEVTSDADLGFTVITRGHTPLINSGGQTSIQRWFDIAPETYTTAPASLRFFYFDSELAGNDKYSLALFSSKEGDSRWAPGGKDASDPVADWILESNVDPFRRFTLGIPGDKAGPGIKPSSLQVYPNPAHDVFTIVIVSKEEGNGIMHLYDQAGNLLEEKAAYWQTGMNTINWDISRYAKGVYYLWVGGSGGSGIKIVRQ